MQRYAVSTVKQLLIMKFVSLLRYFVQGVNAFELPTPFSPNNFI
jgi:hypothetical protein